ncbi:hypothetical protein [uncultured Sphingobium sp.]|uniref:LexA family protein n=1 Tax=uncultured Sphingobium sp. TaxID=316087 RepID=UPI00259B63EE|nr:hypothetical protein [uncultured Sphingobium sp.]
MTPEMRETLTHIQGYFEQHGVAPSYRQLMEMAGVASTTSIHRRVHALVDRGHLIRVQGGARCYVPAKTDLTNVPLPDLLCELERRRANHG